MAFTRLKEQKINLFDNKTYLDIILFLIIFHHYIFIGIKYYIKLDT